MGLHWIELANQENQRLEANPQFKPVQAGALIFLYMAPK
jgi:hypothetical protein